MNAIQDKELDKLIASIKELKESTSMLKESQAKTDAQMAKTDEQIAKTDAQMAKTDKLVKALTKNIDGVNSSIGKEAEEFFYSSLSDSPKLGEVQFDFIESNRKRRKDGEELEIDIFLENGNSVGIVEVKNKLCDSHIETLTKDMQRFSGFYPSFSDYTVYGALAAKIVPEHVEKKALNNGIFVLKQKGNHMEIVPPVPEGIQEK